MNQGMVEIQKCWILQIPKWYKAKGLKGNASPV
jgi:hypothetical protein